MLRKIIEADQLPEYTMTMTKTVEGAPAVLFELRGAAEAAELHARLEAERERHERYEADRRRAGEVDELMDRLARGGARALSWFPTPLPQKHGQPRSEERRVGKEGCSTWRTW